MHPSGHDRHASSISIIGLHQHHDLSRHHGMQQASWIHVLHKGLMHEAIAINTACAH